LQEKLDALVIETTRITAELEGMEDSIREQMVTANKVLQIAGVLTGWTHLDEIASTCWKIEELEVNSVQIMGIRVPEIRFGQTEGRESQRTSWGYGMRGTSGQVDETAMRFKMLLYRILEYASLQGRYDRIILEMNRTRRRVNALDHMVIPRLQGTMRYIEFRLEEREREDLFRRKRMKQIMERKSMEDTIPIISDA